jgi:hypothetical protein
LKTDAAFRIDIVHDPHSTVYPFDAKVYTVEGWLVTTLFADSREDAERKGREWVAVHNSGDPTEDTTLWVDEDGRDAVAPALHSVRV